eukprot:738034_1
MVFQPRSLYIIDSDNNYTIDSFCGPKQYYYLNNSNISSTQCHKYFHSNGRRLNYQFLKIGSKYSNIIYVTFIDDILSHPNINLPGSISPPKVTSVSVRTVSDPQSGNTIKPIKLRLHWDLDVFECSILVKKSSMEYTCNVFNTSQVQSMHNCIYEPYSLSDNISFALFVENNQSDGIAID